MLAGKGLFVWRAGQVLAHMGQGAVPAAQAARDAGITHVIVKVADGTKPYPIPERDARGQLEKSTRQLIDACRDAGILIWGFSFVYGEDVDPDAQARIFAQRAKALQLSGLVVNAEGSWKNPLGAENARRLMDTLRQEIGDDRPFALSSYRYPSFHPTFPADVFMAGCQIAMPQAYWAAFRGEEGDAVQTLRRTHREYARRYPDKQFIPTGAAYGEQQPDNSFWSATPRQIQRFLDEAVALQLPAVNFWSWEHAIADPQNQKFHGAELWDAIASFAYAPGTDQVDEVSVAAGEPESVVIQTGGSGYYDGLHERYPFAEFFPMTRGDLQMKFARSVSTPASVWAAWVPQNLVNQEYEIQAWIPAEHATTRRARYHVHGVHAEDAPLVVEVDQSRFHDNWASLGSFRFDQARSHSGHVQLTNHTGEDNREVAFAAIRWRPAGIVAEPEEFLADGFDPPVGSEIERRSARLWPGQWFDVTGYDVLYTVRREPTGPNQWREIKAFHSGADLNLPGNRDRLAPLFSIASGVVTHVGFQPVWGNIIVIRHDPMQPGGPVVYSRYAHMNQVEVEKGDRVQRGQRIGLIGEGDPDRPFGAHLHFDISPTTILRDEPDHWPGLERLVVHQHYVEPRRFIEENRPPAS